MCGSHPIAIIIGMVGGISPTFIHPGPGYAASCYPKDTQALAAAGGRFDVEVSRVKEVLHGNADRSAGSFASSRACPAGFPERPLSSWGLD